ncbi:hypothetical protein B0H19DRAFT_1081436 [Mycena capillaripes]|nr:hypothetical protein B0H19DRAFT_1081436 [Mycena capillaripes]
MLRPANAKRRQSCSAETRVLPSTGCSEWHGGATGKWGVHARGLCWDREQTGEPRLILVETSGCAGWGRRGGRGERPGRTIVGEERAAQMKEIGEGQRGRAPFCTACAPQSRDEGFRGVCRGDNKGSEGRERKDKGWVRVEDQATAGDLGARREGDEAEGRGGVREQTRAAERPAGRCSTAVTREKEC